MHKAKEKPATGGTVSGFQRKSDCVVVSSNDKHNEADTDKQEFVLATLRCVSLRVRLIDHEIAAAGMALKGGLISPEMALEWVEEVAPGCISIVAEQIKKPQREAA